MGLGKGRRGQQQRSSLEPDDLRPRLPEGYAAAALSRRRHEDVGCEECQVKSRQQSVRGSELVARPLDLGRWSSRAGVWGSGRARLVAGSRAQTSGVERRAQNGRDAGWSLRGDVVQPSA